ncbi:MAG: LysM peptidoglycan-binding domain-containing protein [Chloroflexales bacterium]|nr:LysM peptidoglycan-binding domain-containing protein [Chloroflexales bacterium]
MALEKATITNLQSGELIAVMFNPAEYSLDLGNSFAEIAIPGLATPPLQYVRGNGSTLKMELFFDTFEQRSDVRLSTRRVTGLLTSDPTIKAPPILLFAWGGLNFQCVLERVGQRYTMFLNDGTPVRATLDVSLKEYRPAEVHIRPGLCVAPPAVRKSGARENLSQIAAEVLGDPGAWREIADANNIDNPRLLTPGATLIIPPSSPRPRR